LIATEIPSGLEIEVTGEGAASVPRGPEHLVVKAMEAAFAHLGERPTGIRLTCTNAIPHARGLGSSAAAIVGGLALGAELVGRPFDKRDLLVLATRLEGHPDNVAAAIHGGFTIAWIEPNGPQVLRLDAQVPATVLIPPSPISTDMARRLLPARVPHADAAANAARAALLVAALQGHPELLMAATEDALHQPYRAEAMPQSYELVQELRSVDIPAVISGAGPTVLAFARELPVPDGWVAHELDVDPNGVQTR
jgi:homoserine kinase